MASQRTINEKLIATISGREVKDIMDAFFNNKNGLIPLDILANRIQNSVIGPIPDFLEKYPVDSKAIAKVDNPVYFARLISGKTPAQIAKENEEIDAYNATVDKFNAEHDKVKRYPKELITEKIEIFNDDKLIKPFAEIGMTEAGLALFKEKLVAVATKIFTEAFVEEFIKMKNDAAAAKKSEKADKPEKKEDGPEEPRTYVKESYLVKLLDEKRTVFWAKVESAIAPLLDEYQGDVDKRSEIVKGNNARRLAAVKALKEKNQKDKAKTSVRKVGRFKSESTSSASVSSVAVPEVEYKKEETTPLRFAEFQVLPKQRTPGTNEKKCIEAINVINGIAKSNAKARKMIKIILKYRAKYAKDENAPVEEFYTGLDFYGIRGLDVDLSCVAKADKNLARRILKEFGDINGKEISGLHHVAAFRTLEAYKTLAPGKQMQISANILETIKDLKAMTKQQRLDVFHQCKKLKLDILAKKAEKVTRKEKEIAQAKREKKDVSALEAQLEKINKSSGTIVDHPSEYNDILLDSFDLFVATIEKDKLTTEEYPYDASATKEAKEAVRAKRDARTFTFPGVGAKDETETTFIDFVSLFSLLSSPESPLAPKMKLANGKRVITSNLTNELMGFSLNILVREIISCIGHDVKKGLPTTLGPDYVEAVFTQVSDMFEL